MNTEKLTATAEANPNIAFIKYWGNLDNDLRLPVSGSISMNLSGLLTTTTVTFQPDLTVDELFLNSKKVCGESLIRVSNFLNIIRNMADIGFPARVQSNNNFPTGAGIASSASAFAALSLAASQAAGLALSETELSRLARLGSGSASRSIPAGFVELKFAYKDKDSYAISLAPPEHWHLVDLITVTSTSHKSIGSSMGHKIAGTSIFQASRIADAKRRLDICREAIQNKDFHALSNITELDSNLMHAVMLTSDPALIYWEPSTLLIIKQVVNWRLSDGLPVCYTIDAGPNVHVITTSEYEVSIKKRLEDIPGIINVISASVGGAARLVTLEGL